MSKVQSLSVCCPSKGGCMNHCKTCTARQHDNPYTPKYLCSKTESLEYWDNVRNNMIIAREAGCSTLMITGSNEPQQNWRWLETLSMVNRALPQPFRIIEMQTTGAHIDMDYLKALKAIGLTTLAVSTFNTFDDEVNRWMEESSDKDLCLQELCDNAYSLGLNIRICVNITDYMFASSKVDHPVRCGDDSWNAKGEVDDVLKRCKELHANQVTFRKMWSNPGYPEHEWINQNTKSSQAVIDHVKGTVTNDGKLLNKLPYGASRYYFMGFSIVVDTDSMGQDENNEAVKFYIIREDGLMYDSWEYPTRV